jgi:hypothetical protein
MSKFKVILLLFIASVTTLVALLNLNYPKLKVNKKEIKFDDSIKIKKNTLKITSVIKSKKNINDLSIEELWAYYQINPCYLPLIKDPDQWEKGTRAGFNYEDLLNDSLPQNHKYKNRYLVGDFNVFDKKLNNRGIHEIYPRLVELKDFNELSKDLVVRMDTTHFGTPQFEKLLADLRKQKGDSSEIFINFLEKVWKYRMVPINREYSIEGDNLYAAGQVVALCEACNDTLIMHGRFAVSSKRQDPYEKMGDDGKIHKGYFEYLPYGKRRKYYAGKNRITSKNWETERKYEKYDVERDKEVGGGNNRVTFFRGNVQLPNFLLIKPSKEYEKSMNGNGIHEVALSGLSRGMLGTANSIGCIRVSDFGSKFIRWWVPQNCNFFISFEDARYHSKILSGADSIRPYLPFKNQEEGDLFRKWINAYHPFEAKQLDIKEEGNFKNGFIIDAYFYLKKEYDSYLETRKRKFK